MMSKPLIGSICGSIFGICVVLMMLPIEFADKKAALLAAFVNRFAVGFVIGIARLPVSGWATGLLIGVLLSLPDAIITNAYGPIMIIGAIGGALIGFVVDRWGA